MNVTYHKLCNAFPPMSDVEFAELCESIETSGQREPIVLFGTAILDGKHRYLACQKLGIRPVTRHYDVRKDGQSLAQFVWDRNGNRRSLTTSQRAAAAVEIGDELEKDRAGGKVGRMSTLEMLAKRAGVSRRTISRARTLATQNPAAFEEVKAGTMNISEGLAAPVQEPDDHRDMLADQLAITHGDMVAGKIRCGDVLPGPDLAAFAEMVESDQKMVLPFVCKGWKPKLAIKFLRGEFTDADTIRALINYAEFSGGAVSLVVAGYRIELTEETEN